MSSDEDFEVEVPELADDDPMRSFLPTSFGKKSKEADVAAQIDRSKRTVDSAAVNTTSGDASDAKRSASKISRGENPGSDSAGSDDDSDDSDDSDGADEYPTSHELVLKTHSRAVTTVSLDPAGGRLLTASLDCV
ncbi:hypothetical protein E4U22_002125, partial [Claviceps purpurea]